MKRIGEFRKRLGVTKETELQELKTIYRKLINQYHPDKFPEGSTEKHDAEEKSRHVIEAYHFLLSIDPSTIALALPEYTKTTTSSPITEINFVDKILEIKFLDGSAYEYFGVPRELYIKLANAPSPARFARRHVYHAFIYRQISKLND